MKNRKFLDALGDFVLGKGFYIVLFLCATTIGVSGYYLVRGMVNPHLAATSFTNSSYTSGEMYVCIRKEMPAEHSSMPPIQITRRAAMVCGAKGALRAMAPSSRKPYITAVTAENR